MLILLDLKICLMIQFKDRFDMEIYSDNNDY